MAASSGKDIWESKVRKAQEMNDSLTQHRSTRLQQAVRVQPKVAVLADYTDYCNKLFPSSRPESCNGLILNQATAFWIWVAGTAP